MNIGDIYKSSVNNNYELYSDIILITEICDNVFHYSALKNDLNFCGIIGSIQKDVFYLRYDFDEKLTNEYNIKKIIK